VALLILEGDRETVDWLESAPASEKAARPPRRSTANLRDLRGEEAAALFSRERHGLAGLIRRRGGDPPALPPSDGGSLWRTTTSPLTGLPILGVVLAGIFGLLFCAGDWLSVGFNTLWTSTASPLIQVAGPRPPRPGSPGQDAPLGLDAGINAALSVASPT